MPAKSAAKTAPKAATKSTPRRDRRASAQERRPRLSGGRLVLHFPRLSRAAAAHPQVRRAAGQCRARLLQHAVEAAARHEAGGAADASRPWCSTSRKRPSAPKCIPNTRRNRDSPPDDLIPQFPLIRDAVHAFDIPCLEQAGYEADDLIATYARIACEAKATTTIVSSDKDLMQLVGPTWSCTTP